MNDALTNWADRLRRAETLSATLRNTAQENWHKLPLHNDVWKSLLDIHLINLSNHSNILEILESHPELQSSTGVFNVGIFKIRLREMHAWTSQLHSNSQLLLQALEVANQDKLFFGSLGSTDSLLRSHCCKAIKLNNLLHHNRNIPNKQSSPSKTSNKRCQSNQLPLKRHFSRVSSSDNLINVPKRYKNSSTESVSGDAQSEYNVEFEDISAEVEARLVNRKIKKRSLSSSTLQVQSPNTKRKRQSLKNPSISSCSSSDTVFQHSSPNITCDNPVYFEAMKVRDDVTSDPNLDVCPNISCDNVPCNTSNSSDDTLNPSITSQTGATK